MAAAPTAPLALESSAVRQKARHFQPRPRVRRCEGAKVQPLRGCEAHSYREAVDMGFTTKTRKEVEQWRAK